MVVKYSGLTVPVFEQLRARLRAERGQLRVFKNRLFKLALTNHQFKALGGYLTGANAFVVTTEAHSKIPHLLYKFSQQHPALQLNVAVYDQELLPPPELLALAALPSKAELLAILTGRLMWPVRALAATLQAVVNLRAKA